MTKLNRSLFVIVSIFILVSMMFPLISAVTPINWTDGSLVSYWTFNETSGDINDVLGLNNITNNNTVLGVQGKINFSINDTIGANGLYNIYPTLNNLGLNTNNFSISAWVYTFNTTSSTVRTVISKLNHLQVKEKNGKFIFGWNEATSTTSLQNNTWYHIVGVYNGTYNAIYIDGVLENIAADTTTGISNAYELSFGFRSNNTAVEGWQGQIDEVGIWNRTLNSSEISSLYNQGIGIAYGTNAVFNFFNSTYNTTTYDTLNQNYSINISRVSDPDISSVSFYYRVEKIMSNFNGTVYATNNISSGSNWTIYSVQRTIPSLSSQQNFTFYWNVTSSTGTNYISSSYTQTVNPIILALCNATYVVPFINFTFEDENSLNLINGAFNPITIEYSIVGGTTSKTLDFINTSFNPSYAFCFNSNQTLITTIDATYSGNQYANGTGLGYPARSWSQPYNLTYLSVTNSLLYLLSVSEGISVFIQVVDSNGNKVPGVVITASRLISGNPTSIEQVTTGADGGATFWLNPTQSINFTTYKSGCSSSVLSIIPTQPQYTITLDCGGTGQANNYFQSILTGITWQRTPQTGQMYINSSGKLVTFTYAVQAQLNNIAGAKFTLSNQTAYTNGSRMIVNSTSSVCTPSGCTINMTYFVHPNEILWGSYYADLGNGYQLLEGDANWFMILNQPSSYSTTKTLFQNIAGLFSSWTITNPNGSVMNQWSQTADVASKQEYSRIVFFFLVMAIVLALFSKFTGYDYANPGVFIIGLTLFMFILSIYNGIGGQGYFYYSNLMPNSINGAPFVNNYILVIISVLISIGIVMGALANKRG